MNRKKLPSNNESLIVKLVLIVVLNILYTTNVGCVGCNTRLLADRNLVPDSAFQHSSAVTLQYGASAARDDPSDPSLQERAWCPNATVARNLREFMEIDLGRQNFIKLIITKGRVAQSKGRQKTPYFYVKYRRQLNGGEWFDYAKENGTRRLTGNQDAMTENFNAIDPPFVARFIRIYPFSVQPIKTCLKLQIIGCKANGIVEYESPMGTVLPKLELSTYDRYKNDDRITVAAAAVDDDDDDNYMAVTAERLRLVDTTYDAYSNQMEKYMLLDEERHLQQHPQQQQRNEENKLTSIDHTLSGGLGKLTDNDTELKSNTSPFSSHKFVGWRRQANKLATTCTTTSYNNHGSCIRLLFNFDMTYSFKAISLYVGNDFLVGLTLPRNITLRFWVTYFSRDRLVGDLPRQSILLSTIDYHLSADKQNTNSRWITLPTEDRRQSMSAGKLINAHMNDKVSMTGQNRSDQIGLGIGNHIEILVYFNSEWLAIGEVLFDNDRIPDLKFNPMAYKNKPIDESNNAYGAVMTDTLGRQEFDEPRPMPTSDATHSIDATGLVDRDSLLLAQHTTTYVLATICSLLVILICSGLFCLFCVWSRRHKTCWLVRSKLQRDTNKAYRTPDASLGDNLPRLHPQHHLLNSNHHPHRSSLSANYKLSVNHDCLLTQSSLSSSSPSAITTITSPSNASASSSLSTTTATNIDAYNSNSNNNNSNNNNNSSNNINPALDPFLMSSTNKSLHTTTLTTASTIGNPTTIVSTAPIDDLYQYQCTNPVSTVQYPSMNGAASFVPTNPTFQLFTTNGLQQEANLGSLNLNCNYSTNTANLFIPIGMSSQFTNNANNTMSLLLNSNAPAGLFDESSNYRQLGADSSIYTTLPESDCDSQPYAKVVEQNGSIRRGSFTCSTLSSPVNCELVSPIHTNTTTIGNWSASNLFINANMKRSGIPPPPSLPLPPTPEHLNTTNTSDNNNNNNNNDNNNNNNNSSNNQSADMTALNLQRTSELMHLAQQQMRQMNQYLTPKHLNSLPFDPSSHPSSHSQQQLTALSGNHSYASPINCTWLPTSSLPSSPQTDNLWLDSNLFSGDRLGSIVGYPHNLPVNLDLTNQSNNTSMLHNSIAPYNQATFYCSKNLPTAQTIQMKR